MTEEITSINFFDLPGEIRNKIYELHYRSSSHQTRFSDRVPLFVDGNLHELFSLLSAFCVNRQLYEEASSYLYGTFLPKVGFYFDSIRTARRYVQMIPKLFHQGINGTISLSRFNIFGHGTYEMTQILNLIAKELGYESYEDLEDHPSFKEVWYDPDRMWRSRITVENEATQLMVAWDSSDDDTNSGWLYLGGSLGSLKCLEEVLLCESGLVH